MKYLLVGVLVGANLACPSKAQLLLRQRRALSNSTAAPFVDVNQDASMSMGSIMADLAVASKSGKSSKSSKPEFDWCPDSPLPEASPLEQALQAFKKENDIIPSKRKGKTSFPLPGVSTVEVDELGSSIDGIVGGNTVDPPRKYKFFGLLHGCAASLIAPNVVLSAAHCQVAAESNGENRGGYVTLGLHTIDVEEGDADEFKNIESIPIKRNAIHPCYDRNTFLEYDFMVSELEWSTTLYMDAIVDLDGPDDELDLDDGQAHTLTAIGFGDLFSTGGFAPNVLQEVSLNYDATCGDIAPSQITDSMLCAGGEAGEGTCQGDSGGALYDPDTNKLVGITSWGYGCASEGLPDVFARVSHGYDWIESYRAKWASDDVPAPEVCAEEIEGWYTTISRKWLPYSCLWFAEDTSRCLTFGDSFANGGSTANEACCACSGLDFPSEINVAGGGVSDATFDVDFHYTGSYMATSHGLEPATINSGNVAQDEIVYFPIPLSGAAFFRAALPPFSVENPLVDLDLYLLDPNYEIVSFSYNSFTNEVVEVTLPADGIWHVAVEGWDTVDPSVDFDLYSWIISMSPGGSLIVDAPDAAVSQTSETIGISWKIDLGKWYLGAISHTAKGMLKGLTLVEVNNIGPLIHPKVVDATGQATSFDVAFAYDGSYTATAVGLSPSSVKMGALTPRDYDLYTFTFANVGFFRAVLQVPVAGVDFDLFLLDPANQPVSKSETDGNEEVVEITLPADGEYSVYVLRYDWWGGTSPAPYNMISWTVPAAAGSMAVDSAPESAQFNEMGTINLSWSGGDDEWSLGAVIHANDEGVIGTTTVSVDNRA